MRRRSLAILLFLATLFLMVAGSAVRHAEVSWPKAWHLSQRLDDEGEDADGGFDAVRAAERAVSAAGGLEVDTLGADNSMTLSSRYWMRPTTCDSTAISSKSHSETSVCTHVMISTSPSSISSDDGGESLVFWSGLDN